MKKTALIPLILCLWVAVPTACNKSEVLSNDTYITDDTPWQRLSHEKIELGDKLEDPYTVENVTKAIEALYPTKAGRITLKPTDIYARFLPKDDKEFETLMELGVEFMDHPLDYAIIKDGDYYHDPEIPENEVTWQYAVRRATLPGSTPYCRRILFSRRGSSSKSWTIATYLITILLRVPEMTASTGTR